MSKKKILLSEAASPELLAEWDYEKNGDLTPDDVTRGSNKKVWWTCPKGHSYQAAINNKTARNTGCPYCTGQKALAGFNDLTTTDPSIAAEWDTKRNDNLTPNDVTRGSNKKVYWVCSKNHSWQAMICSRTGRTGANCPYCAGKKVLAGFNDFATAHPNIAAEWDYKKNDDLKPTDITAHSHKRAWWICPKGHSYQATVKNRTTNSTGCPYCSNHKVLIGFNDLATTCPSIAAEWDYGKNGDLKPTDIVKCSAKKVWWICPESHSYQAQIIERTTKNQIGCPYCAGRRTLTGINDLATTDPDIAAEWDTERNGDLTPDDVKRGSDKKVWWICPKGHSYQAQINNRIASSKGCPYCINRRVLKGFNDLATTDPDIAAEWDIKRNGDLTPNDVTRGADRRIYWICPKGHSYQAIVCNRTNGTNCPYCADQKTLVGFNDLATTYPRIAAEWDYKKNGDLKPTDITKRYSKKVWWTCPKGHSYRSTVGSRTTQGSGCPLCNQPHGETYINNALDTYNVQHIPQWSHKACKYHQTLRFDSAIFANKHTELPTACIEYQGIQHYQPIDYFGGKRKFKSQQKRDAIKRKFCKEYNIPLILIPYSFDTQEKVEEMLLACLDELGIQTHSPQTSN